MALYESVFIARQDVSSSQVDSIADALQKVIEDNGGQVPKREYWGLRNLSYKIKKNRKGHYALFNIDAPAEAPLDLTGQFARSGPRKDPERAVSRVALAESIAVQDIFKRVSLITGRLRET